MDWLTENKIPVADVAEDALDWLQTNGAWFFDGLSDLMERLIEQSIILSAVELIDLTLERSGYKRLVQEDKERGEERWDSSTATKSGVRPKSRAVFYCSVQINALLDGRYDKVFLQRRQPTAQMRRLREPRAVCVLGNAV